MPAQGRKPKAWGNIMMAIANNATTLPHHGSCANTNCGEYCDSHTLKSMLYCAKAATANKGASNGNTLASKANGVNTQLNHGIATLL